ncbi:hypothetical protein PHYPSEUDO_014978 [Phytophthora pseudosyringae]|uniref:Uncharacterized protein n=1 Tax=Phytophthora pseudosyringae TaxID=221518 RepID=A0A8T1V681_9STRA|nr:hypothetical protein PHYPSEUDO_014978 [Phytophthora pseudosyringae]
MHSMYDSACSDVDFASPDEEDEEGIRPTRRLVFQFAASFSTLGAAKAGIDTFDASVYKFSHNYGKKGHGERVYKCVSHPECAKRLRLAKDGDAGFKVEHAGTHDGEVINVKKKGIHGAFRQEVGDILLGCGRRSASRLCENGMLQFPGCTNFYRILFNSRITRHT